MEIENARNENIQFNMLIGRVKVWYKHIITDSEPFKSQ